MNGFLYFLPGSNKPADATLKAAGLGHLCGQPLQWTPCTTGPAGVGGVTFGLGAITSVVAYQPGGQSWDTGGPVAVGWYSDAMPAAGDLARDPLHAGHDVGMGDGRTWHVPAVRFLPKRMRLGNDGEIVRTTIPAFADLERDIQLAWSDFTRAAEKASESEFQASLTEAQYYRLGVGLLAANYRIGTVEIDAMGLFTDDTLTSTIRAGMDVPGLMAMLKKNKRGV